MLKEQIESLIQYAERDDIYIFEDAGIDYILTNDGDIWFNKVQCFIEAELSDTHPLKKRILILLNNRIYRNGLSVLNSLKAMRDDPKIEEYCLRISNNKIYDVFISYSRKERRYANKLYNNLKKYELNIFLDTKEIDWGDNWQTKIIDSINKAEFAIVVISKSFFDREWTEKELNEFSNMQYELNRKVLLPILKGISVKQFCNKYPYLKNIEVIESKKNKISKIATMFSNIFIKRLKGKDETNVQQK